MRLIKLAIISAVVLFALATAMSSLLPSTVRVSRAIDITAPADSVHAYVNNINNWKDWLQGADSAAVKTNYTNQLEYNNTFINITSTAANKIESSWRVGNGQSMKGEMNFISQHGSSYFTFQWSFSYHVKWYPWEKFASILSDKSLGPYMEASLDKLKKQVEQ